MVGGLGQMPVPPIPNSARANAQTFPNSRTHLQKSTMPNETLLFISKFIKKHEAGIAYSQVKQYSI